MENKKQNDFIIKANLKHDNIYDYSLVKYVTNKTKIKIICKEHGEFMQTPNNHLNGSGCPVCGSNNRTLSNLERHSKISHKLQDKFIKKANEVHDNKYDYSNTKYVNARIKVKIICPIHGEFEQLMGNHINGRGCFKCGFESSKLKQLLTKDEIIKKGSEKHNNKYDYSLVEHIDPNVMIKIICPIHGEFKQLVHNHLYGRGCPSCKNSKGEKQIKKILNDMGIKFISQHILKGCKDKKHLKFDFYLPDYNTCIEYNGEQHYIPVEYWGGMDGLIIRQKRDKIKKEYCEINNIPLIIINYNDNIIEKSNSIFSLILITNLIYFLFPLFFYSYQ